MANLDQALATQLANIEKRSGKSLAQLSKIIINSGLAKHGERVAMLKATLNMGHGDANAMAHYAAKSEQVHADVQASNAAADVAVAAPEQVLDGLYTGANAALRGSMTSYCSKCRNSALLKQRRKKPTSAIGATSSSP